MPVRKISSTGSLVIPAALRRKYGLEPGTEVQIVDYGGVLALVPALVDPVRDAAGMLKSTKSLTSFLMNEHHAVRDQVDER